ncbi:hypothetical protein CERZMDRAFT_89387 [Cercospora zeae-maydis SCOH1-5]|uniref:Uncharacterized protein n=1 Tax=Cercospora zeae-maydis SCOH1-5 TaxID=717836 RepID=A0A6A6F1H1_9PEZI|nr:hypothetical protein CERZMDRAFT_89387 [Cercospora zeae-maydis SCOH1-5]
MRPEFRLWREQRAQKYPNEPRNGAAIAATGVYARATEEYHRTPRHQLTEQEIKAGWKAYRRYHRQQSSQTGCTQDVNFQIAFRKLPNIYEVVVAITMHNDCNVNSWPFWNRFHRETLFDPGNWKNNTHSTPMARRNALGSSPVKKLNVQHIFMNHSTLNEHWRHAPGQPVDLLRTWYLQAPQRLWSAQPFAHLTDLSMRFRANYNPESLDVSGQIHQLLIGAKELRRLGLVLERQHVKMIPYHHEESDEICDSLSVEESQNEFGEDQKLADYHKKYTGETRLFHATSVVWPKIEHLALSVSVSSKRFAHFRQLHSSTLESLELCETLVSNASKLLEQIPKVLQLDRVFIKRLYHNGPPLPHRPHRKVRLHYRGACLLADGTDFDAPYEQAMKAYLLRQSPDMPDVLQDHLDRLQPEKRTDRLGTEPVHTVFCSAYDRDLDYVKIDDSVTGCSASPNSCIVVDFLAQKVGRRGTI